MAVFIPPVEIGLLTEIQHNRSYVYGISAVVELGGILF